MNGQSRPLLEVKNLKTYFHTEEGVVRAVDDVSFTLRTGEVLGLVGESGCGKSVTSYSVMQLVPIPPGRFEGGKVLFKGRNLLELNNKEMRKVRGNEISMIFQEPMTALNPVMTVGRQIDESLFLHTEMNKDVRKEKTIELLDRVGISDPGKRIDSYPHEMSGGMRQRVMIAIALACDPDLLIADEPTTALDVTIQAQILELIKEMQELTGSAMMLITHDLAVIAETADRVAVMYAGRIVESSEIETLYGNPKHPYTQALLKSIPVIGEPDRALKPIPGFVPNLIDLPDGCPFADRCDRVGPRCRLEVPAISSADDHEVRCHLYTGGVN